jgi:hypothetical protein
MICDPWFSPRWPGSSLVRRNWPYSSPKCHGRVYPSIKAGLGPIGVRIRVSARKFFHGNTRYSPRHTAYSPCYGRAYSPRHGRAWPGHPRLLWTKHRKSWMAGTRPARTRLQMQRPVRLVPMHIGPVPATRDLRRWVREDLGWRPAPAMTPNKSLHTCALRPAPEGSPQP